MVSVYMLLDLVVGVHILFNYQDKYLRSTSENYLLFHTFYFTLYELYVVIQSV